jgi:23S rRNA pseudouridine2457 synthase
MLLVFNKPYGVLSQFTPPAESGKPVFTSHRTLSEFGFPKHVYPIGRLDADSEGLLLLTDEPKLNSLLLVPAQHRRKVYWAQVENFPTPADLDKLGRGVAIQGCRTLPAKARLLEPQPNVPDRVPPIRVRKNIPACWIELELTEGKNRQVRRMTATIGFPTLRLIRVQIGMYRLGEVPPGLWKALNRTERLMVTA